MSFDRVFTVPPGWDHQFWRLSGRLYLDYISLWAQIHLTSKQPASSYVSRVQQWRKLELLLSAARYHGCNPAKPVFLNMPNISTFALRGYGVSSTGWWTQGLGSGEALRRSAEIQPQVLQPEKLEDYCGFRFLTFFSVRIFKIPRLI